MALKADRDFVFVFGPKNNDFLFFGILFFDRKSLMSFRCYFIFRPKSPRKTAVNAMNWGTNEMLKSEYFAKVCGFRCNKQ